MDMRYSRLILNLVLVVSLTAAAGAADLETVVKRHVEAMGGSEALTRIKSVSMFATIEGMGMKGTQTSRVKFPFMYHVAIDLGVMSQEMGFDGITGWSMDPNGIIRKDIDETLKPMINEMYYASLSYALSGGIPGKVTYRGDTLIEGDDYHHLALFPDGGDSISIFIGFETGLVEYRKEIMSGLTMISSYTDFHEIEGVTIPQAMRTKIVEVPYDLTARIDSISLNDDLPDSLFIMPGQAAVDYLFADEADSLIVPFRSANNLILVDLLVNGRGPYTFLLDSGAGITFVSTTLADSQSIAAIGEVPARGVGGYGRMSFGEIDSLNIGGLSMYLNRVAIFDLGALGSTIGGLDGVLGYDFFTRFAIKIDFMNKQMTLYQSGGEEVSTFGEEVPVDIYFQTPILEVQVNGQPIRLGFDLGAQPALLIRSNARVYESLRGQVSDDAGRVSLGGVGGQHSMVAATIDSLRIGEIMLADQPALISEDFSGLPLPDYIEGLIGVGILKNFDLLIDYSGGRICFARRR